MAPRNSLPRPDELARRVLTLRLGIKPRENVLIESYPSALPWATAFVRQARRLNARPLLVYEDERSYWDAIDSGHVDSIGVPGAVEWAALEAADAYVYFWGPEKIARRARLPERIADRATAFNREWYDRARKAGVRGLRMELAKVTPANARFYGIRYRSWWEEILRATARDPREFRRPIARLERALSRGTEVRLTGPGGTDLRLGLDHGPVRAFDGRRLSSGSKRWRFGLMATVPSAAVGIRLDGSVAEGTIVANRPSYLPYGVAQGGRARFAGGKLQRLTFAKGGAPVRKAYGEATTGRDRPGLLEVGFEPGLHGIPDLEDCEAGAVTVGIGGNQGFGGRNQSDFVGWLVVAGGRLSIDGRDVVRGGRVL